MRQTKINIKYPERVFFFENRKMMCMIVVIDFWRYRIGDVIRPLFAFVTINICISENQGYWCHTQRMRHDVSARCIEKNPCFKGLLLLFFYSTQKKGGSKKTPRAWKIISHVGGYVMHVQFRGNKFLRLENTKKIYIFLRVTFFFDQYSPQKKNTIYYVSVLARWFFFFSKNF